MAAYPMSRFLRVLILTALLVQGSTACAGPSGDRFSSFAGFSLGETTFKDVQATIGDAMVVRTGEAGGSLASLCYTVDSSRYILFLAGELDGPEHYLGGFDISDVPSRGPCSPWPKHIAKPSLDIGGLHLGMSVSAFKTVVGVPIKWEAGHGTASFENKQKMSAAELAKLPTETQAQIARGKSQDYYDVVITISATFKSDKLREVRVWKTETL